MLPGISLSLTTLCHTLLSFGFRDRIFILAFLPYDASILFVAIFSLWAPLPCHCCSLAIVLFLLFVIRCLKYGATWFFFAIFLWPTDCYSLCFSLFSATNFCRPRLLFMYLSLWFQDVFYLCWSWRHMLPALSSLPHLCRSPSIAIFLLCTRSDIYFIWSMLAHILRSFLALRFTCSCKWATHMLAILCWSSYVCCSQFVIESSSFSSLYTISVAPMSSPYIHCSLSVNLFPVSFRNFLIVFSSFFVLKIAALVPPFSAVLYSPCPHCPCTSPFVRHHLFVAFCWSLFVRRHLFVDNSSLYLRANRIFGIFALRWSLHHFSFLRDLFQAF